jgi:hypothetical protein
MEERMRALSIDIRPPQLLRETTYYFGEVVEQSQDGDEENQIGQLGQRDEGTIKQDTSAGFFSLSDAFARDVRGSEELGENIFDVAIGFGDETRRSNQPSICDIPNLRPESLYDTLGSQARRCVQRH